MLAPPGCRKGNAVCRCLPQLSHAANLHQQGATEHQDLIVKTTEGEKHVNVSSLNVRSMTPSTRDGCDWPKNTDLKQIIVDGTTWSKIDQ